MAIFLPRKWRHQPQGTVEVDPRWESKIIAVGVPRGDREVLAFRPGWRGLATPNLTASAYYGYGPIGGSAGNTSTTSNSYWSVSGVEADLPGKGVTLLSVAEFFTNSVGSSRRVVQLRWSGTSNGLNIGYSQRASAGSVSATGVYGADGTVTYCAANNGYPTDIPLTIAGVFTANLNASSPDVWVNGQKRPGAIVESTVSGSLRNNGPYLLELVSQFMAGRSYLGAALVALPDDEVSSLLEHPWQLFRAPSHRIWVDVGAGAPAAIEGDIVAEESGADTLAATGSVVVAGSLAAAEAGADTFAATGGAVATGTLAASETGVDTLAFAGEVLVAGSLAATETGADTVAATGKVLVVGTLNAAETGADTASVTGLVLVAGTLSAAEAGTDTFSASGAGQAVGTLAAVEVGTDTITAAGQIVVSGALSASEAGSDTWAATGAVRISGSFSASESGTDTFSSTGEQPAVTGDLAASEIGVDGFAAVGIVPAIGSFDLLEAGHDSLTGAGQIIVAGILGAAEVGQDAFIATPAGSISGVMAAIEAADTFAATGHGRAPHGARRAGDRGYSVQTTRRPQVQTMRRPRQNG